MPKRIAGVIFIKFVKLIPIVTTAWLAIAALLLMIGIKNADLEYSIFGHSLIINMMLLSGSLYLKFCNWHRMLIYNLILINMLEWINNRWYEFPDHLLLRSVMFVMCFSILTSTILYFKYGAAKNTTTKGIGHGK